ncbi:MAG TPA: glutamate 5-kinase [Syntrophorhabdus aromaticivorans]|nr:glutamate 5-kinase [Syntrophorhabdus aromaticivorans]
MARLSTLDIKRVVLKIGTSVLLDSEKKVSIEMIKRFAQQVRRVKASGMDVVIVSSGAVACGMQTLNLKKKPREIEKRQALASIGQVLLMKMYMEAFESEKIKVGQILLTHEDIKNKERCLNLMNTLNSLLAMDIVPVINENDALSFTEIKFGDNDNLSALIAQISDADLLLLLSDVDGLFDKDPNRHPSAKMIKVVQRIDEEIEKLAEGTKSEKSIGGMVSKIEAAKKAGYYGIPTMVVRGDSENIVLRVMKGEETGTLFLSQKKLARKKWWTAFAYKVHGIVWVDEGAEQALLYHGKSLLPSGVVKTEGDFRRGECIEVNSMKSKVIARGITNYSSADVSKIKGLKSVDIERKLGYKYTEEIVHRDNMVII